MPEDQLLIQLSEIEHVLRLSALLVHARQEVLYHLGYFWYIGLVGIVIRRVFHDFLQQEGISSKTSGWLGEIAVEFQFAGGRVSFSILSAR